MMNICPTAEPLWRECVRSINEGTIEEYATAWQTYQAHKRECQQCKDYLHEYLIQHELHFKKQHYQAIVACGVYKC